MWTLAIKTNPSATTQPVENVPMKITIQIFTTIIAATGLCPSLALKILSVKIMDVKGATSALYQPSTLDEFMDYKK